MFIVVSYLGFYKYFLYLWSTVTMFNSHHHYVLLVHGVNYRENCHTRKMYFFYFHLKWTYISPYKQTKNTIYQNFQRSDIKLDFQQSYATFNNFLYLNLQGNRMTFPWQEFSFLTDLHFSSIITVKLTNYSHLSNNTVYFTQKCSLSCKIESRFG
jgi:hypothetical protein